MSTATPPAKHASALGPLQSLLSDAGVSAVLVNGPRDVFVERDGSLARAETAFADEAELLRLIGTIAAATGNTIDESSPMLDARLPDGMVVNAIVPPLAIDGPVLSLRRPTAGVSLDQLVATRSLNRITGSFLTACVRAGCTVLVAGSSGAGKSTLLQALVGCIPSDDRIVTIEEAAELRIAKRGNKVRLATPVDPDKRRKTIGQAARLQADRLVVADLRAPDVAALIDALFEDADGALATIHAMSLADVLQRLESLYLEARPSSPIRSIRRRIASTVDVVAVVAQGPDRVRRVVSIAEPELTEGGHLRAREIFRYERAESGAGRWTATGVRPRVLDRIAQAGIDVPDRIFDAPDQVLRHET